MKTSHFKILLTLSLCISPHLWARDSLRFLIPSTPYFNPPTGIVFPSAGSAGGINPASLTLLGKSWGIGVSNSIPFNNSGDYGVGVGVLRNGRNFSIAGGYLGTAGATTTHGYFGGIGARFGKLSVGALALQAPDPTAQPRFDVGFMLPMVRKMAFAVKFENVATAAQAVVGAGFQGDHLNLEVDIRLPPMTNMTAGYEAVLSSQILMGRFSLQGAGSYQTISKNIAYSTGMGLWITDEVHLAVQYSSNSRLTVGLSLDL